MTENLINDLLDLGKLQNNKFKLDQSYFSLPETIMQSFEILAGTAAKNDVRLVGMIDKQLNLDFITCLFGD